MIHSAPHGTQPGPRAGRRTAVALTVAATLCGTALAAEPNFPITEQMRATARDVAAAGVALSELTPTAPDRYTVKRGDTLWDISKLYLASPWRWPELWGMNLHQVRNPHLIYPGQLLILDRSSGRAVLRFGQADSVGDTVKLSPRVRGAALDTSAIASIPLNLIGPFLNEAVVFDGDALEAAPRIVATQEGRVLLSSGETAYVRGDLGGARDFRVFREPKPLLDPATRQVLGYEARFVGLARFERDGEDRVGADGKPLVVPATFRLGSMRLEAGIGDRLSPVPQQDLGAYAPHAPDKPVDGRIVSIYGEALLAGQNQIVALNKGASDGIERGHVLALWRAGRPAADTTVPDKRTAMLLPDERHGLLFVFRVFNRVSYALVLQVQDPVTAGDRFTQP